MPGGRPKKEIDKTEFEKLCALQCTIEEFCCFFDITDKTLDRWCKDTYKMSYSEIFAIKRGVGKISLRRTQMRLAEKSPAMAIFLGKNYLGQSDKIEYADTSKSIDNLLTIADLIKNPVKNRTIEDIENE